MTYQVVIPKPVEKQLDKLRGKVYEKIVEKILELKHNPRPPGCVKLKGYQSRGRGVLKFTQRRREDYVILESKIIWAK